MSEQRYRVIADRDKGDDPTWADVSKGDRYLAESRHEIDWDMDRVVRIERPVPTTDDSDAWDHGLPADVVKELSGYVQPSLPTREQIAEAVARSWRDHGYDSERIADAVLALIRNGSDR